MMRKDVRIGFAIGGVLLAVLIVYGLITSGPNPRNNDVTLAPDDPASGTSAIPNGTSSASPNRQQPAGGNGAQAPGTTTSRDNDAAARNDSTAAAKQGGTGANGGGGDGPPLAVRPAPTTAPADKWERALNHGELMARSETPMIGSSVQPTPQPQPQPQAGATDGTTTGAGGATGTSAGAEAQDAASAAANPASTDATANAPGGDTAAGAAGAGAAGAGAAGDAAGGGVLDARVLADIAAGGSGTTASIDGASSAADSSRASISAAGQRTHVVQPNETFASIAEVAYGSQAYYPHLVRANPNVNPKRLRAGMTIVLPDREQVVAKHQQSQRSSPTATGTGDAGAAPGAASTPPGGAGAVTVATPPLDEKTHYRVQVGESLYKIALKLYGRADKVNSIYDLNKDAIGPNRDRLKAGTVLKLPEPPTSGATAAR